MVLTLLNENKIGPKYFCTEPESELHMILFVSPFTMAQKKINTLKKQILTDKCMHIIELWEKRKKYRKQSLHNENFITSSNVFVYIFCRTETPWSELQSSCTDEWGERLSPVPGQGSPWEPAATPPARTSGTPPARLPQHLCVQTQPHSVQLTTRSIIQKMYIKELRNPYLSHEITLYSFEN